MPLFFWHVAKNWTAGVGLGHCFIISESFVFEGREYLPLSVEDIKRIL